MTENEETFAAGSTDAAHHGAPLQSVSGCYVGTAGGVSSMDRGWIKTWRKLEDWQWFKFSETLHVFLFFLIRANHKPGCWRGIKIGRGQLITGIRSIQAATGISARSVRTSINRLISTHEVTRQTTHFYSIITICNYDQYQSQEESGDTPNDKQNDNRPTHHRHTTDNKQECKKERMKEESVGVEGVSPGSTLAVAPTFEEFQKGCYQAAAGGPPDGYIRDRYLAQDAKGWASCPNWRAYAARVRGWWVAAGRPADGPNGEHVNRRMEPPAVVIPKSDEQRKADEAADESDYQRKMSAMLTKMKATAKAKPA
jgi:hypothetical protein